MLFVPVSAPWMRASEAIEFARAVKAPRNLAIHDRVYSEAGLGIVDGHMNAFLPRRGWSTCGSPTVRTSEPRLLFTGHSPSGHPSPR